MSDTLYSLGKTSKTTFLLVQDHKLAIEFEVNTGQTLYPGQPVKLTDTGKITLWAPADTIIRLIGYVYGAAKSENSTPSFAAGELVTVLTRGYAMIYALSGADDQVAGPVAYSTYDTSTIPDEGTGSSEHEMAGNSGYSVYVTNTTATQANGWALDAGDEDAIIQVLLAD